MAVYVDEIQSHPHVDNYATRAYGHDWCHLIADSREELDAMARKIGLRTQFRQKSGTIWEHYDLIPRKRDKALAAGAIPISIMDMGRMWADRLTPQQTESPDLRRASDEQIAAVFGMPASVVRGER